MLLAAGDAPRRPDVEDECLAAQVLEADDARRVVEAGESELRRLLVDQRRRHFARVALQADGEDHCEREERRQRDQEPESLHAVAAAAVAALLSRARAR